MRYLVGFVLLLMGLGTLRVAGCGDEPDERIPCETREECDDDNECTDDVCIGGYCEVGLVYYNPSVLCDIDGVEQFYEDGVCVSGICESRESCTDQYMCEDWICGGVGDLSRAQNLCTHHDTCDEGTCTYTLEPNGSSCCYKYRAYDCSITHGCSYDCTQVGECQDGQCCLAGNCYESRPRGYGCGPF